MNEDTKTITAAQFAPILHSAFVRYAICVPNENAYRGDGTLYAIAKVMRSKIDRGIDITEKSILTENIINKVADMYTEKADSYKYTNWYNILRGQAWKAAAKVAFEGEEMPIPEYIPTAYISQEVVNRLAMGSVERQNLVKARFRGLLKECDLLDEIKLTAQNIIDLKAATTLNPSALGKFMDVLDEIYEIHFGAVEAKEEKPEVVEMKNLDEKIVQQLNVTQEVQIVMDDYMNCINGIVASVINALETINKCKAVELDDDEKEKILAAIGYKGVIEEIMQAKKRIEELQNEVDALSVINDDLERQLKQNKDVRQKLMSILGETAA